MVEIVKMESSGLHKLAPVVHVVKRKDEGEDKDLDYHMVLLPGTQIVLIFFENTHPTHFFSLSLGYIPLH